jgi:S-adenosylmethionine decarboxylase
MGSMSGRREDKVIHLRTRSPELGIHLLAEWYGCPRSETLRRADTLRVVCVQLLRESGLQVVSSLFEQFQPSGVVGTLVLSDAHIAIHTWPDTGFVALDFYACHDTQNSRAAVSRVLAGLREVLRPVWVHTTEVNRGVTESETSEP